MFIPVNSAGGASARLWPLSRQFYPKQRLALRAESNMLQGACAVTQGEHVRSLLVCNEECRFPIAEQLSEAGTESLAIVLEQVGRNTTTALTVTALAAGNDEAMLCVPPADHLIKDKATYVLTIRHGISFARRGAIVTFGIVPTASKTGYDYIKRSAAGAGAPSGGAMTAYEIGSFQERPDEETARRLLESSDYYQNSDMFMVRADVWLELIGHFLPDVLSACEDAYHNGRANHGFYRLAPAAFEQCPSDSIDYAVMESLTQEPDKEAAPVIIPIDCNWSDVGARNALWNVQPKDADGNVMQGDVFATDTRNSLVYAQQRFVTTLGIDYTVVVETDDAVLVTDKTGVQDVKAVVH